MALGFSFKWELPGFLHPEVPGISTLKKMANAQVVSVLRMSDHGRTITLCDMMLADHWIYDDLKKIHFMQVHDPIKLSMMMADQKPRVLDAYIVDDDTASTVEFSDLIAKSNGHNFKLKATGENGEEIGEEIKNITVPEHLAGYVCSGSTVTFVSSDLNKNYYSPGPAAWDWFMDNKAIKDMFPSSINPGWFAVIFVIAFTVGGFSGTLLGILLGKLLLG